MEEMRRVELTLAAVAAICMLAFGVGVAQANQFIAEQGETTEGEFAIKGASGTEDPQVFAIGETRITCAASRAKGALSAPSETFEAAITFKHCVTEIFDGRMKASTKVVAAGALPVEYFADGEIEALAPIELDVKALDCRITLTPLGPQPATVANESFSTPKLARFPSGFQHKLAITGGAEFAVAIPKSCDNPPPIGGSGGKLAVETGMIFDESPGADLGYEEAETLPEGWNLVKNAPQ